MRDRVPDDAARGGYRPFPDVAFRNALQRRVEIPWMIRALALPRGGRILETGCGRGVALEAFAERLDPSLLVGVDLDGGLLRGFLDRGGGRVARIARADVRALPFPDGAFDLVVDFGTLFHILRADRAVAEIARVLAPGGILATETRRAQRLSHPIRTRGRRGPANGGLFDVERSAGLWASYTPSRRDALRPD